MTVDVRIGRGLAATGLVLLLAGCLEPSGGPSTPILGSAVPPEPSTSDTSVRPAGSGGTPTPAASASALLDAVRERGSVRVLLSLAVDYTPEADLPDPDAVRAQRARITETQQRLLAELGPYRTDLLARPERLPQLVLAVDEPALRHLLGSPFVATVEPDTRRSGTG